MLLPSFDTRRHQIALQGGLSRTPRYRLMRGRGVSLDSVLLRSTGKMAQVALEFNERGFYASLFARLQENKATLDAVEQATEAAVQEVRNARPFRRSAEESG
jgi:hypothetical protein